MVRLSLMQVTVERAVLVGRTPLFPK